MASTRTVSGLLLCWIVLLAMGCSCNPRPYNVTVTVADSLKDRTIYVDLVAVNEAMGQTLKAKSMTEYWRSGDKLRSSLDVYDITFLKEDNAPRTLSSTDPIWEQWSNSSELFVLARLPGEFTDQPGDLDGRRLILPLGSCRWDGDTIEIVIREGVVTHTTPLLPEPD